MTIEILPFGEAHGQQGRLAILQNDHLRVEVINYGAVTKSIRFGGHELLLGYDDLDGYLADSAHIGAIAGRCANRIAHGRFKLDGKSYQLAQNCDEHHLHGGLEGFGKRFWQMSVEGETLKLELHSPDGDQNYPNAVDVTVLVSLSENALIYEFEGFSDGPTLLNLAQHNYYDLGGEMQLQIDASHYTEVDETFIPTGNLLPVHGMFDYSSPKPIDPALDHNFALSGKARLIGAHATMELVTDQLGLQAYAGQHLPAPFKPNQAVCLEPQFFPNAVNEKHFKAPIFDADSAYHQRTELHFKV